MMNKTMFMCVMVGFLSLLCGDFNALLAQINTPAGATIPFGTNTMYTGSVALPTNLPTSGTYTQAQDAADAYNQWKTDYVEACGSDQFRVRFDNASETVSEGIAYGMLLSAYAADKTLFDGLWTYYKNHSNNNGVMNWKISGCNNVVGTGGAADAEIDAAMALLVAHHQWGSNTNPHDYEADVTDLIQAVRTHEIQPSWANGTYQLNNGDQWGFNNDCRNPSYQAPAYFKQYGTFTGDPTFWDNCADASYTLLNNNVNTSTGLISNWSDPNGTPNSCNGPNEYGWDACRNPWRMATDVAWYDDAEAKTICNQMAAYVEGIGASSIAGPVSQNGGTGSYHAPTFISTFALGVMGAGSPYQSLLNEMYTETVDVMDTPPWYFGNTLRCVSLFMMTGNFWSPLDAEVAPAAPIVQISSPQDGSAFLLGNVIDLTAVVVDNDGTLTDVTFTVNGNMVTSTMIGNTYNSTWTPTIVGEYTFEVSATDNDGQTTVESVTFIVNDSQGNTPPTPCFTTSTTAGNAPLNVTFDAACSNDADGDPLSYDWNFGNGDMATGVNTTYTFTNSGIYTVVLTVSDNNGGTATEEVVIDVQSGNTGGGTMGLVVEMEIYTFWNAGFCANLHLHNTGTATINGWDIGFNMNAEINNLWNGNWSGSQAEGYMVSNLNWNGVIDGGETVTIGFCADHDGSLLTPTDVTVSGMPTEITLNYTGDDPGTFIGANIQEPTSSIDLKLLPSVNNGAFQLELNAKQAANYQLAVFSSTGQMMALLEKDRLLMAQNALHYQLDLPNGLYYLQASNSLGAKAITKLVVVK